MAFCGLKTAQNIFFLCSGGSLTKKNKIEITNTKESQLKNKKQFANKKSSTYSHRSEFANIQNFEKSDNNWPKPKKDNDKHNFEFIFDEEDESLLEIELLNSQYNHLSSTLNMSKNATVADICDKEYEEILKVLNQASLSKGAHIPMLVVKSYKPNESKVDSLPKVSNGIKIFTNFGAKTKQLEIHRGMTVNALFCRNEWLYVKTAQNECGYVPIDTCKPVFRKDFEEYTHLAPSKTATNSKFQFNDKTNVSLFDISQRQSDDENTFEQDQENISELEFSMYENPQEISQKKKNSDPNFMRLYKIRHYLNSLEQSGRKIDNNYEEALISNRYSIASTCSNNFSASSKYQAVDSGYSDCDSISNLQYSKQISQSYETLLNNNRNVLTINVRRGIKTNGSIYSVSPNPSVSSNQSPIEMEKPKIQINEEPLPSKLKKNLSTIIEQSYNTTLMSKMNTLNESECEATRHHHHHANNQHFSDFFDKCEQDVSQLQKFSSVSSLVSSQNDSNLKVVLENYEAVFLEDLSVFKGESVTILEDQNPEWLYVVSENGKGYVPRSCIYL